MKGMPDLQFQITGAEPERFAVEPLLRFALNVTERVLIGSDPTSIHTIVLRCQIRIEPGKRSYSPPEQERLLDLFGTPDRWGRSLRPMLWTHTNVVVPSFAGACRADIHVPCSSDFELAATKYFSALEDAELPLCFLFSETIFHEGSDGALQVIQIPWEKEAAFRLPVAAWRAVMDQHYPNSAWVRTRQDVFDRLAQFRRRNGLTSWEQTLERLLAAEEVPVAP
jgi:hypothetical protein